MPALGGCDRGSSDDAGSRNRPDAAKSPPVRPHFVRRFDWLGGNGVRLKADLHVHTKFSDGALSVEEVVAAGVKHGCNVLAITDHADANLTAATPEYFAEIEAARRSNPSLVLLAGLEWNVPPWEGREHATLLTPAGGDEQKLLGEFKIRYDDWQRNNAMREPSAAAAEAISWLTTAAAAERTDPPLVLYNHPNRNRNRSSSFIEELASLRRSGPVLVGFEGAPGHQRAGMVGGYKNQLPTIDRWDPAAAKPGDAWDQLLQQGEDVWGALASSDFHSREGISALDYWPGEFSETWLEAPKKSPYGVLAALRAGTFFAAHGHVVRDVRLRVHAEGLPRAAEAGEVIRVAAGETLSITLEMTVPERDWQGKPNRINQVELIVVTSEGAKSLVQQAPEETGPALKVEWKTPPKGAVFRARGRRSEAAPPHLMFYTNSVRVLVDGESESPRPATSTATPGDNLRPTFLERQPERQ
jgi:hypothetical protein